MEIRHSNRYYRGRDMNCSNIYVYIFPMCEDLLFTCIRCPRCHCSLVLDTREDQDWNPKKMCISTPPLINYNLKRSQWRIKVVCDSRNYSSTVSFSGEFHRVQSHVRLPTELSFASATWLEKHHKRTRGPGEVRGMNTVSLFFRKWGKYDFLQRSPARDFLLQGADLRQIAEAEVTDS